MIRRALLILWARLIDCHCVEDDLPAGLRPKAVFSALGRALTFRDRPTHSEGLKWYRWRWGKFAWSGPGITYPAGVAEFSDMERSWHPLLADSFPPLWRLNYLWSETPCE